MPKRKWLCMLQAKDHQSYIFAAAYQIDSCSCLSHIHLFLGSDASIAMISSCIQNLFSDPEM